MSNLQAAIELAVRVHSDTTQWDGSPYILHPMAVMLKLHTEPERIVAILHDVVEDTDVTLDDLRAAGYTAHVVDALEAVTRRPDETYEQFIDRLAPNPLARRVKLADLEHNMDMRRITHFEPRNAALIARYVAAWRRLRALEDAALIPTD